jgi:NAD(P)-dependent dehydrogenase (short-subunit alcohol dehydrogenase family)
MLQTEPTSTGSWEKVEVGSNRVALVTGGGSGLGRAGALAFAAAGFAVVVVDLDGTRARSVAGEVAVAGGRARALQGDVADEAANEAMVSLARDDFGGLDCAYNCAGTTPLDKQPLTELDEPTWDRVIDTNLKGIWLSMKHEIPAIAERGGGCVVNVASAAAFMVTPTNGVYHASKAGVVMLTRFAAQENAARKVRVNAIAPTAVMTPMIEAVLERTPPGYTSLTTPLGRLPTAEEIAEIAIWFCSDAAAIITGKTLVVDGGTLA